MPSDDFRLITGSQLRAARALVRWSVEDLADRSRVAVATVIHAEAEEGLVTAADARSFLCALEEAGVEFIAENGGGVGVRFARRSGPPDEGLRLEQLTSENDS